MRIKWFVAEFNRFEMGRIVTAVIRLIQENMSTFDGVISEVDR